MKGGRREKISDFPVRLGRSLRHDNLRLRTASQHGAGAEARSEEGNEESKEGHQKGKEGKKDREKRAAA